MLAPCSTPRSLPPLLALPQRVLLHSSSFLIYQNSEAKGSKLAEPA
jgi:hypothetical protein